MILKRGYEKCLPLLVLHLIQLALPLCGSEAQIPLCNLPMSHGNHCGIVVEQFYYDSAVAQCRGFLYYGCDGNENRFATKSACEEVCSPGRAVCALPPMNYVCQAFLFPPVTRYYFSNGECIQFGYFGCPGNGNNFHTLQECLETCSDHSPPSSPSSSLSPSTTLAPTPVVPPVVMATDVLLSTPPLVSTQSQPPSPQPSSPLPSSSSSPPATLKEPVDSSTSSYELLRTTVATRSEPTVSWGTLAETPSVVSPVESTSMEPVARTTDIPTSDTPERIVPNQTNSKTRSSGVTQRSSSFSLSVFDCASIGVGVLVLILFIFLMGVVSALVYRQRKIAKRHREIHNSSVWIKASTIRTIPLPLKPLSLHSPSDASPTCSSTGSASSGRTSHTGSSRLPFEIYV